MTTHINQTSPINYLISFVHSITETVKFVLSIRKEEKKKGMDLKTEF